MLSTAHVLQRTLQVSDLRVLLLLRAFKTFFVLLQLLLKELPLPHSVVGILFVLLRALLLCMELRFQLCNFSGRLFFHLLLLLQTPIVRLTKLRSSTAQLLSKTCCSDFTSSQAVVRQLSLFLKPLGNLFLLFTRSFLNS